MEQLYLFEQPEGTAFSAAKTFMMDKNLRNSPTNSHYDEYSWIHLQTAVISKKIKAEKSFCAKMRLLQSIPVWGLFVVDILLNQIRFQCNQK